MDEGGNRKIAEKVRVKPEFRPIFIKRYLFILVLFPVSLLLLLLSFFNLVQIEMFLLLLLNLFFFVVLLGAALHSSLERVFTSYEINENVVLKRHGIVNKRSLSIPLEMITDLAIKRDILDQGLESATLLVNTAGTVDYTMHVRHISVENAVWMNNEIVKYKKALHAAQEAASPHNRYNNFLESAFIPPPVSK